MYRRTQTKHANASQHHIPLTFNPIDRIEASVVEKLVESTLAFGVKEAHLHIALTDDLKIIVDIWSNELHKKKIAAFMQGMSECSINAEIRHNPLLDTPLDAHLYDLQNEWKSKNISVPLSQALLERRILIQKNAKFEPRGSSITIDPQLVRTWIMSELPESIDVRAIDFPEIHREQRNTQRTIALITCTVPVSQRKEMTVVLDRFEKRFGIEVALNPVSARRTLQERLQCDGSPLASCRKFTPEHVPELKKLLQTTLRWRTAPKGRKSEDLTDLGWISIDSKEVILREDLIHISSVNGKILIRVAKPDITAEKGMPGSTSSSRTSTGAFYLGKESNAWVVEFGIKKGALKIRSQPYRALVRNMRECEPNDPFLKNHNLYRAVKSALNCSSDYRVIAKLMSGFSHALGSFLKDESASYLVRQDNKTSVAILKRMLEAEKVLYGTKSLTTKTGILRLMKHAQLQQKYQLLPLLAAQLTGSTIVCRSDDIECGIKPQRGTRELLNQWILASVVDGWNKQMPEFMQDILAQPAMLKDASSALMAYESERKFARMLRMFIGVLEKGRETRIGRIESTTPEGSNCWIPTLKRHGFIEGVNLEENSRVQLRISAYDSVRQRFICTIAPPRDDMQQFALEEPLSLS